MNFERVNNQSNDLIMLIKHTRMVVDIDGGSLNSNARLLQYPQKKNNFEQVNQRFRLRPIIDSQQEISIPAGYIR